jgi:hypothetical protein
MNINKAFTVEAVITAFNWETGGEIGNTR